MSWCWWCCHPYESPTLHMPFNYDDKIKKFKTAGQFCSWSCIKAYALERYGLNKGGLICQNLTLLKKHTTGELTRTWPAPSRQTLKVFGGTLTIDEFRAASGPNAPIVHMPNELHITHEVIEKSREYIPRSQPTTNKLQYKLKEINNAASSNEPLRLKRSTPLKRDQNNLEQSMGIVRTKKS